MIEIGTLVRHPLSGDIGIITDAKYASLSLDDSYYTVAFFNDGEFLIPEEHLEV